LLSKLSSGKDPSLLLKDREQYVRSKIDYLSEKGRYIGQGKATTEEINDFQQQKRDLTVERKQLSYDSLTKKFDKKPTNVQIEKLSNSVKPSKVTLKQFDTKIQRLIEAVNPLQYALKTGLPVEGQTARVLVDLSNLTPEAKSKIQELGTIESEGLKQVQVRVPIDKLEQLGGIGNVKQLRPPTLILQHSVISEGVPFINADIVQQGGFTGAGVDVAVLDLSFVVENH